MEKETSGLWLQSILRAGTVVEAETALKIAEILLLQFQGAELLDRQRPLKISDGQDRWLIEGTIDNSDEAWRGATWIAIAKKDCQVLGMRLPNMQYTLPK